MSFFVSFTLSTILGLCAVVHEEYVVVDMSQPHDVVGYKSVQIRQGVVHFCNPFDEHRGKMALSFGDWIGSAVDGDTIRFEETNLTAIATYYDHDCQFHWLDKATFENIDNMPIPPGKMSYRRYQDVETNLVFAGGIELKTFPPVRVRKTEVSGTIVACIVPANPIRFSQSVLDECFMPSTANPMTRLTPQKFYVLLSDGRKAIGMVSKGNTALRSFATGENLYIMPSEMVGFSMITDGAFPSEECLDALAVDRLESDYFQKRDGEGVVSVSPAAIVGDVRSWVVGGLCTLGFTVFLRFAKRRVRRKMPKRVGKVQRSRRRQRNDRRLNEQIERM